MHYVLGISGLYHDSAAALLGDGRILAAVQEERLTKAFEVTYIQIKPNEAKPG